jgi:hypothetical protein
VLISLTQAEKGQPLTVTLDVTELAAISKISNDSFFSDRSNWKSISIEYKSPVSEQKKIITFNYDGSDAFNQDIIFSTRYIGNTSNIQKIYISGFDNASIQLNRSDIPLVSNYDILLEVAAGLTFFENFLFPDPIPQNTADILDINGSARPAQRFTLPDEINFNSVILAIGVNGGSEIVNDFRIRIYSIDVNEDNDVLLVDEPLLDFTVNDTIIGSSVSFPKFNINLSQSYNLPAGNYRIVFSNANLTTVYAPVGTPVRELAGDDEVNRFPIGSQAYYIGLELL